MQLSRAYALLICLVAAALGAACSTPVDAEGCARDRDCPSFYTCEVASGLCLCTDDNACDDGEFCNTEGRCQARTGCRSNQDCKSADRPLDICDTTGGECITLEASTLQCTRDSHCPFGTVCEGNLCQTGCRVNGDCPLGEPCMDGQCDPTPGACNEVSYCEYGEMCNLSTLRCAPHAEADTLCEWCQPQQFITDPEPCGGSACLFDSSVPPNECSDDAHCSSWPGAYCNEQPCQDDDDCPGSATCEGGSFISLGRCSPGYCQRTFCGSSSCDDETDPCPKGYSCYRLITVTGEPCTAGGGQCQGGRACQVGGENEVSGFCSCIDDGDCPIGTVCTDPGPNGTCITGTTCGPQQGLLCEDLR